MAERDRLFFCLQRSQALWFCTRRFLCEFDCKEAEGGIRLLSSSEERDMTEQGQDDQLIILSPNLGRSPAPVPAQQRHGRIYPEAEPVKLGRDAVYDTANEAPRASQALPFLAFSIPRLCGALSDIFLIPFPSSPPSPPTLTSSIYSYGLPSAAPFPPSPPFGRLSSPCSAGLCVSIPSFDTYHLPHVFRSQISR